MECSSWCLRNGMLIVIMSLCHSVETSSKNAQNQKNAQRMQRSTVNAGLRDAFLRVNYIAAMNSVWLAPIMFLKEQEKCCTGLVQSTRLTLP